MKIDQTVYNCKTRQTRIEEVEVEEITEELPVIQKPSLEERITELESKNKEQDIEIALNQEVINCMLLQSTSMMLSEQTKGTNLIAFYLANQILKGRLDYHLVISRHVEFKEDIDSILISEGKQELI